MTTLTPLMTPAAQAPRRAAALPALGRLVLTELRRMGRNPMFALSTIGFPVLFFGLFGLPAVKQTTSAGANVGQIILSTFAVYSLLSLAMFSFGSAIAAERTSGWLRLLRASPLPLPLFFAARIIGALVFGALAVTLLYAFAHVAGGVTLPLGVALTLLLKLLLGLIPLITLGLAIGFLATPQAAQITAQIVSVIMSFASGLFVPLPQLPRFVQQIAPYMPAYHLGQISTGTVTGNAAHEMNHWLALGAFALLFGGLAVWSMKRDESREG